MRCMSDVPVLCTALLLLLLCAQALTPASSSAWGGRRVAAYDRVCAEDPGRGYGGRLEATLKLRGGGAWDVMRGTAMEAASKMLSRKDGESAEQDASSVRRDGGGRRGFQDWLPWSGTRKKFEDSTAGDEDVVLEKDGAAKTAAGGGKKGPIDYSKFDDIDSGSGSSSAKEEWQANKVIGEIALAESGWDPYESDDGDDGGRKLPGYNVMSPGAAPRRERRRRRHSGAGPLGEEAGHDDDDVEHEACDSPGPVGESPRGGNAAGRVHLRFNATDDDDGGAGRMGDGDEGGCSDDGARSGEQTRGGEQSLIGDGVRDGGEGGGEDTPGAVLKFFPPGGGLVATDEMEDSSDVLLGTGLATTTQRASIREGRLTGVPVLPGDENTAPGPAGGDVEGPKKVEDKDKEAVMEELECKLDEVETTVMPKVNEMMDEYRARLKRIDEAECLDGEWDDTSSDDDIVKREDFPRGCDVMTRDGKSGSVVQVNYDFEDPDKTTYDIMLPGLPMRKNVPKGEFTAEKDSDSSDDDDEKSVETTRSDSVDALIMMGAKHALTGPSSKPWKMARTSTGGGSIPSAGGNLGCDNPGGVQKDIESGIRSDVGGGSVRKRRRLWRAARAGDCGMIQSLFDGGEDLDSGNPRMLDATPLHYAAMYGHVEAIGLLVKLGAGVNSTNRWGATPLHAAAFMGHAGAIRALVHTHGAEVSPRDMVQSTPLHHAALALQRGAAEVLVEAGADVAAKDEDGDTPLENSRNAAKQQQNVDRGATQAAGSSLFETADMLAEVMARQSSS